MPSNLYPRRPGRALAFSLLILATRLAAQESCPPQAGAEVALGWAAYRADSIGRALVRFSRADRLCRDNYDAKVGLGYSALRQNRIRTADSLFRLVVAYDSTNADAWDGLAHAAWRGGNDRAAARAARRALRLNPRSEGSRALLDRLEPDWNRDPPAPRAARPARLMVAAQTRGEQFMIPGAEEWEPFYIKGVNLGVGLPGKFASEFPSDSSVYAGWLDTIAAMHANTVRLYTILPPSFYRALEAWNRTHPDRALWLMHGVWTELPPQHDFSDSTWLNGFREEMRRVVDVVHGAVKLPPRTGHASGQYDADVSRWTLGYIIGREWEPYAVKEFDARHPGPTAYLGRYLEVTDGSAMDGWLAEQCDFMLSYEVETYNTLRPIAYTNWPTLDPLQHPTETSSAEEIAWRRRAGRPIPVESREYENDAVSVDATIVHPTQANVAGWFASYHAYPYYPDFMLYDSAYSQAASAAGPSNYFGYLDALHRHHAGIPLVIAEYGVPSSRGNAHLQPQGWNHGGHDEAAMAEIDARLTREIRESGAAGGIIFAWIDEWFKKNWMVIDYEIPLENTRQWHNQMDPEQNYGILGMYAGDSAVTPVLGGDPGRWLALPVGESPGKGPTAGRLGELRIGNDESYVYLALSLPAFAGRAIPWDSVGVQIALDTYRPDLGQRQLLNGAVRSEIGFEFLVDLGGPDQAELRIVPEYNPYVSSSAMLNGDEYGQFAHRPITIRRRADGRFDSLWVISNRSRFTREGRFIPAQGYNRGRLRFGSEAESTLSDWCYDEAAGILQIRLPWGLLNVSDPSTATVLFEQRAGPAIGSAASDGFRLGALLYRKGKIPAVLGSAPALAANGLWPAGGFHPWKWATWDTPRYYQRLKPVYHAQRQVWGEE